MLKLLEHINHNCCSPAKDKCTCVDADQAEVIIFKVFRWHPESICWKDLLLLLEGELVNLSSSKNQFSSDVCVNKDTHIFVTSKSKIEDARKHNISDERETQMMDLRWKITEIFHKIPQEDQKSVTLFHR